MEDITFQMAKGKFNLRVAGVIIKDSKILVMSDNGFPYFYLPGGRVQLHEPSEAAIRREILEELSEEVVSLDVLWVVENFFLERQGNADFHEICFFYSCELHANSKIYKQADFTTHEIGRTNSFKWVLIDELDKIEVVPTFLKQQLSDKSTGVRHFTFDQDARFEYQRTKQS